LTEFHATKERTERWLIDRVANDDTRLLFMVDDLTGNTIGYMGLAFIDWRKNSGEADAIVRGKPTRPGLMTLALGTLLRWSRNQLGLQQLGVRVRSDNPALEFYKKFGFTEVRRVGLRRDDVDGETRYVPDDPVGSPRLQLVYMELKDDSWGN
jgi:RimJ/RimL family protein N-acetyltransferase